MSNATYQYPYAPLATRRMTGKVLLTLPIAKGEGRTIRPWLHNALGDRAEVSFDGSTKLWTVARSQLGAVRDAIVVRYGVCDVETENRISQKVQCDDRCQEATGLDCVCSCGGEFHGVNDTSHPWVRVGDTTLIGRTPVIVTTQRRYVRPDLAELWGYTTQG